MVAKEMLSGDANGVGARTTRVLSAFDHALQCHSTACLCGCGLPERGKRRRKRWVRTCWPLGAPGGACRPARWLMPRCCEPQSGRTWPTHHLALGEGLARERWRVLGCSHCFVLTEGLGCVTAWHPRWFPSSWTIWPSTPRADATTQTRDPMREGQASSSTAEQRTSLHVGIGTRRVTLWARFLIPPARTVHATYRRIRLRVFRSDSVFAL